MFRTRSSFFAVALAMSLMMAACGEVTSEEVVETTTTSTAATQPPATEEEPQPSQTGEEPEASDTIVEVAVASGAFPTLVAAVEAAGLVETLNSNGPFTVFAPTEEAFATALENLGMTAGELLANTELLTAVLTYASHCRHGGFPSPPPSATDCGHLAVMLASLPEALPTAW